MQRTISYLGHLLSCIYTPTSAAMYKGGTTQEIYHSTHGLKVCNQLKMVVKASRETSFP